MTPLTDEHFLENIRKNPGDDLARGIYADWLEEAGDERTTLVRLFDQVLKKQIAPQQIVQQMGGFSSLVEQLGEPEVRPCRLDLGVVLCGALSPQYQEAAQQHTEVQQDFMAGNARYEELISSFNQISQTYMDAYTSGEDADVNTLDLIMFSPLIDVQQFQRWCKHLEQMLTPEMEAPVILILTSYVLFGTNITSYGKT